MEVLASVYACSPYDGSERAVGWNWIHELDRYHKITALTSSVYKKDIDDYLHKHPGELPNTKFIYITVPKQISFWHKDYRGERLYYILWQYKAFRIAKRLIQEKHFDIVHHITYVTCILPTYMYKLGLPFLYGPVSGGEKIPDIINYPMSKKNELLEFVRIQSQRFFIKTHNFSKAMMNSSLILVTTEETKQVIPKKYWNKTKIFQAIGLGKDMFLPDPKEKEKEKGKGKTKFLIAGRMIYWKGFELAIYAFIKALKRGGEAELTILGDVENDNVSQKAYREKLKKICGEYLEREIKFVSKIEHSKMKTFYDGFDVLLNCSLRDSGCFVVMEAMSRGLPVICVDTGGPRVNTSKETAIKIEPAPLDKMLSETTDAILTLISDENLRKRMGKAAKLYAAENFVIENRTSQMNQFYRSVIDYKEEQK